MSKPAYLCVCGKVVPGNTRCECQIINDRRRRDRHDRKRPNASQRGYNREWREARALFLQAFPKCRCGEPATVVDHIIPHKGNMKLFWNRANWQPLCEHCHNSWKQKQERQQ
ncbi:HNH endonuclease [Brucella grignonensis]|uniref:HNH endonuclease n=1 Tax=Brucella grignonensis TaxID=94627 RepID=UPI000B98286D|nr:HNH endonuclease signature motif containing protein [Brucella grignonensis]NKB83091.1 HNH endonuclease [Brucella grignonensis]